MMYFMKMMLRCLLCTIVIELLAGLIMGVRNRKDIINIVLVNVLTNPLVVSLSLYVHVCYGYQYFRLVMIFLEVLVVIIEGVIYKRVLESKRNPYLISLVLNASSYGLGLIINLFI